MLDQYGRKIDYLRISVTDRCDLRCRYCMPEPMAAVQHADILRYEEILRICCAAALTVYDMCKAVQKDILISDIHLLEKTGGVHGDYSYSGK